MANTSTPFMFEAIVDVLDETFPEPQIPLHFDDPFSLLMAVILSAQCTDKRVNEIMPKLLQVANTPEALACLGVDRLTEIIRPCGLYARKAPAMIRICEILCAQYGGKVPKTRADLEALPCVGRKTANVVLSHAFGVPAFPVDTHILRLSQRWQWSKSSNPNIVERDLCALFEPQEWLKRHLQMILFGRTYCKALGHCKDSCLACCLLI